LNIFACASLSSCSSRRDHCATVEEGLVRKARAKASISGGTLENSVNLIYPLPRCLIMATLRAGQNEKDVEAPAPLDQPGLDADSAARSISSDRDVAIGLVGERAHEIDPELERRVLRKIDRFLIPAMVVGKISYPASFRLSAEASRLWTRILRQSHPRQCRSLRHDKRPVTQCHQHIN
jgi:hypothetical protein